MVYLLFQLIALALPPETALQPQPGGTHETVEERAAREVSIAVDAAEAVRLEGRLPGRDTQGSAVDLLGLVFHESGFRYDVDSGRCRKGDCDAGYALCLAQIHPANAEERVEVTETRLGCFRVAIRRMRGSIRTCGVGEGELSMFCGGQCDDSRAVAASRAHLETIRAWRARAAKLQAR